jgi:hypothetical protein
MAMGKKPKHRVRHIPPGPCGIWYQATQAKKKQVRDSIRDKRRHSKECSISQVAVTSNGPTGLSEDPPNSDYDMTQQKHPCTQDPDGKLHENNSHKGLEDTPSAWQEMQNDTNVTTPYNPTPWTTVIDPEERYQVVRNNLPEHYVTLWEILRGDCDMKLAPHLRLRVLVHAVEMSHHHNIWTVDLRDDTGASMRAWMEPRFIQEQLQNSMMDENEMSMIRPGLVWMLRDVSMMIFHSSLTSSSSSSKISEERLERMLLISGQHVEKIWYPKEKDKDDNDSHQRQGQQQPSGNNCIQVDDSNNDRSQSPQRFTTIQYTPNDKRSMDHEYRTPSSKNTKEDDNGKDRFIWTDEDVHIGEARRNLHLPLESLDVNSTSDSRPCTQLSSTQTQNKLRDYTVGSANASQVSNRSSQHTKQQIRIPQTLTIDTATVYDSQEYSVTVEQSQSMQTSNYSTQEERLNTQESTFYKDVSTKKRQTSSHKSQLQTEDYTHTPKSTQTPKVRRTKNCSVTPIRNLTTPTPDDLSPRRSSSKRSPRKFCTIGSMWEKPSEFILDMIEQEEKESLTPNKPLSCLPKRRKDSLTSADSESPALYIMSGDCEKLYDPSSWAGVDLQTLDVQF